MNAKRLPGWWLKQGIKSCKHIVNFSGDLCSFWALKRTIDKHGAENTIPLFADVLIEAKDLYEFNRQTEVLLGVKIVRVSREMTPWELFRKEGLIGNTRSPICSIRLKRELLNEWMESNFEMDRNQDNALLDRGVCALGFDWSEAHRVKEMQDAHPRWRLSAPMTEDPIWDKCRMEAEARKLGLVIGQAYEQGFPHNNCGKRCVRARLSHWVHLYHVDRPAYMEWAIEEAQTQREFETRGISNSQFTILRDRRGGTTKPLSLLTLADRIAAGEEFPKDDWGGCGCGGAKPLT